MLLRSASTKSARILQIGLFTLALAGIVSYFVQRNLPESVADPVSGFVYGVGIATTLLGLAKNRQSMRGKLPRA